MQVRDGDLHGTLVFEPVPVFDDRGFFTRTFDSKVAADAGLDPSTFVQDSQSRSRHGVLRGLHFRTDGGEGKLVRCSSGAVFDVAVDLRPWSPTFLRVQSVVLDDETHLSVFLPPGLAHGFLTLSEVADVCYRIDAVHRPDVDGALAWNDPELAIPWPAQPRVVSERDSRAPALAELRDDLPRWFGRSRTATGASDLRHTADNLHAGSRQ